MGGWRDGEPGNKMGANVHVPMGIRRSGIKAEDIAYIEGRGGQRRLQAAG